MKKVEPIDPAFNLFGYNYPPLAAKSAMFMYVGKPRQINCPFLGGARHPAACGGELH